MFWRRKKDDEAATDTDATDPDAPAFDLTAPEIDLDAPEPDPSDFELEPAPATETSVEPSEPEAVSDPEHLADLVAAVEALPEPVAAPPAAEIANDFHAVDRGAHEHRLIQCGLDIEIGRAARALVQWGRDCKSFEGPGRALERKNRRRTQRPGR